MGLEGEKMEVRRKEGKKDGEDESQGGPVLKAFWLMACSYVGRDVAVYCTVQSTATSLNEHAISRAIHKSIPRRG